MRRIIFTRPDGGVSVVYPVINTSGEVDGFTEAQAEQRAWDRLPVNAINPRWADASEISSDRTFRNAWEDKGGIKVNIPKAREIHKAKLREIRKPLLAALDIEYMRADEVGNQTEKVRIAARKQALRDVTAVPEIAAALTPESLKLVMPAALL